jgi:predicted NAD-dependent protein-ADP-ribosyltransferase YbiA (DUF1768 family)
MITFYAPQDPYGCFSNFSRHEVRIQGRVWQTSEHFFQAMKYSPHRPDLVDLVHQAKTPGRAAALGRDRAYPIRADWDSPINPVYGVDDWVVDDGRGLAHAFERNKDYVMYEVVKAKFTQNDECKKTLLSTGEEPLIEDALHDPYWGWGSSKTGINRLGKLLMVVRHELQHAPL